MPTRTGDSTKPNHWFCDDSLLRAPAYPYGAVIPTTPHDNLASHARPNRVRVKVYLIWVDLGVTQIRRALSEPHHNCPS
jgi:hypothetical protein